jgi:hypothetical protein
MWEVRVTICLLAKTDKAQYCGGQLYHAKPMVRLRLAHDLGTQADNEKPISLAKSVKWSLNGPVLSWASFGDRAGSWDAAGVKGRREVGPIRLSDFGT